MSIVLQTQPAPITENDWSYYFSMSPAVFLRKTAVGLKENNRYLVDERFQKLLFAYMFAPQSRYQAQTRLDPPRELFRARVYKEPDVMDRYNNPNGYGKFQGYDQNGSGAVPRGKITPGRVNPEGVSISLCSIRCANSAVGGSHTAGRVCQRSDDYA